jgi:protein-disulfide isomerase
MVRTRMLVQLAAVLALAAIVVVGLIVISGGDDEQEATQPKGGAAPQDVYAGIPQAGIHLGKSGPPILLEFADLQCPFCAEYATTAMPSVVSDYVRTGRVRYELRFRSFLGPDSVRAAGAAAYAASQDRMYQFADLFYRNQGDENSGYADDAFIRRIASQVPGLAPDKAVTAANNALDQPGVRTAEQFARQIGSRSTPDFYIRRGRRLVQLNIQGTTPGDYARAIDEALARQ